MFTTPGSICSRVRCWEVHLRNVAWTSSAQLSIWWKIWKATKSLPGMPQPDNNVEIYAEHGLPTYKRYHEFLCETSSKHGAPSQHGNQQQGCFLTSKYHDTSYFDWWRDMSCSQQPNTCLWIRWTPLYALPSWNTASSPHTFDHPDYFELRMSLMPLTIMPNNSKGLLHLRRRQKELCRITIVSQFITMVLIWRRTICGKQLASFNDCSTFNVHFVEKI